uniref:Uncharacterized protein n=1 Tax=Lactuca sativa TaxID=4236 RepID=A0A9R1X9Z4_LACSA|nr:hypothetical protein LSAT_V11C500253720 [Lactuca sativa]
MLLLSIVICDILGNSLSFGLQLWIKRFRTLHIHNAKGNRLNSKRAEKLLQNRPTQKMAYESEKCIFGRAKCKIRGHAMVEFRRR